MIRINVSPDDLEQIYHEKAHNPHPRVRKKMEAILLKHNGLANNKICKILSIAPNTLTAYLRQYNEGGVQKLKEINFYQPQSELVEYEDLISTDFDENPPATLKEAMVRIEKLCGIKRSIPQVRNFLLKMGRTRKKVAAVPAKANIEQQDEFFKKL